MLKVLIADDNAEMLETLEQIFTFYQFDVIKAKDGAEAIKAAEKQIPDLVVLDGMMPVMDGFEACKALKSKSKTKEIPVVFLTANYIDVKDRVMGFELGADDYILKPFNSKELVARCKTILQRHSMMRMLRNKNEELNTKNKKIEDELANLLERSKINDDTTLIDNVTGLYNFGFFQKRLKEEFLRAKRHENELSVVVVGFRNLEKINEVFGHQIGNYVIMKMANSLLNKTRASDVLARSDNDRFYIILPQTDAQGCYFEAERIRITLSSVNYFDDDLIETIKYPKRRISDFQNIGINLGAVTYPIDGEPVREDTDLLNYAEDAFKKSRATGDNITIAYGVLNG